VTAELCWYRYGMVVTQVDVDRSQNPAPLEITGRRADGEEVTLQQISIMVTVKQRIGVKRKR